MSTPKGESIDRPLRVAVQGEPGCFSHAAALEHYRTLEPHDALELVPCRGFDELFAAVLDGRADRGCVPVENALHGAVSENLDLLVHHPLCAVAEVYLRVEMCLAVRPGSTLDAVRRVGSHPVALRQCRRFFSEHAGLEELVAHDTAGSIRDLMNDPAVRWNGAIGPALAAELYGAEVALRGIEDHARNYTRFLIVARDGEAVGENAVTAEVAAAGLKATLAFTLPHRPGALHQAIGVFAAEALDLTRLESRPIAGRPWEYRFHVDVRGASGAAWDRAMIGLDRLSDGVRVIGRYPEVSPP
ncbi:MAG: prephenate dehydratase domain-containing protein [Longimicrobiales bacterium]|nr:prephenate dehydratase domain-containing protein [Longimicrobiales bacterium]